MSTRQIAIVTVALVGAFAFVGCGGGAGESGSTNSAPAPGEPALDANAAGGTVLAGIPHGADEFIGMPLDVAISFAEEQGRQWRIGSEDGEELAVTADLVPGRVTFTIEDGVVTAATIEEDEKPMVSPGGVEDQSSAELLAKAVERLVTVDNSFGGGDPFERIEFATVIGDDGERPVEPLALELIAAAIEPVATVEFIADAQAAIDRYFDGPPQSIAVVAVDDLRVEGERAEVDLALWCGSLCGIWLTYEAKRAADGWEILGTTGPIAIS